MDCLACGRVAVRDVGDHDDPAVSSVLLHGAETVFFLSERRGVVYARARVSLDDLLHGFQGELSKRADARARATFAEARTLMNEAVASDPASGQPTP